MLATLILLVFSLLTARAEPGAGDVHALHHSPPAAPTVVEIGLYLVGLTQVAPASAPFPTFDAEVLLSARWHDPRLAFDPEMIGTPVEVFQGAAAEVVLERIWSPELMFENEEGSRAIEHRELDITAAGDVTYKERSHVHAHADVNLRRFPFDTQHFELRIAPFAWDHRHVVLAVDAAHTGHDPGYRNLEWVVQGVTTQVADTQRMRLEDPVSVLTATISAERLSGFYLYKLIVPLAVIVMFTWSAFWMTAEPSGGRMQRTFVALLTVVAFHHIVAGHLPRIAYLTFLDAVVYACFAAVGATLLTIVRIHNLDHTGHGEQARRLERRARWLQPAGFALTLVALWVGYHL